MKSLIIVSLLFSSSFAMAEKCIYQADYAAKKLMKMNQEKFVSTTVRNIQNVNDGVNTDYNIYDVFGLNEKREITTLTYRISVDPNNSCRIIRFEYLGGN